MDREFNNTMAYIEGELRNAGYDPYAQLTGYVQTHDERYITRNGDARSKIMELDWSSVKQYVKELNGKENVTA